ncbi:calmodulin-binding protein 60 B isoform X4 [Abrus precatorius]|uniref:Calmodulin-binding protein 60 B isoform X4 n=1 Tax=Abrus precatorius TaxID=3816 RepID=A0A8B8JR83_ABRPR|nr:calmodulin-binding protein 60 B isoform X4 [Abrus precatorius]
MQRPTTDAISMGKRSLESGEDDQPERKRPALASVIVEALKVDSLQKLCSSLEPILRRVVSEEVERALAKLGPARLSGRSPPKMIEGPDGRSLQLQFRSRLSLPLFTGGKVEGDFNNEDDEDWTQEEFESHVVKEREGKRPLLTGDLQVTLKEGVGTLGELTFTDNSSWIRSRKFRLGLKVASGFCESIRIREAKTVAFTVKDHRGELYKKHYPPALSDEVWRLEKIGKDGSFHKKLNNAGILTVEDFLRLVVKDQQRLRNILGSGMSNKMWEALLEHAKTCVLSGKLYVYYPEDTRNVGVIFNNIYELRGLISGEQFFSADSLTDSQKVYVDSLVKKAYDNWDQVVEYDGKSLVNANQNNRSVASENELRVESIDYGSGLDHQLQMPALPVSVPSEQEMNSGMAVGGYDDNMVTRYPTQSLISNSNSRSQFESSLYLSNDQLISNAHQTPSTRNDHGMVGLALGPPQSLTSGFHAGSSSVQPSTLNPFDDWSHNRDRGVDEFFSEEEIRNRSHEMLENEDMQHLLRLFSMGGHASMNAEDGYSFPSFMPSPMPNYDEDRSRPGRAVVGWLKIKAAMRWGFFIRKIAAEKRAQIEELDE